MSHPFIHKLWLTIIVLILMPFSMLPVCADEPAVNQTFASKNFWELNQALAVYRNAALTPWPIIPDEPRLLKVGTTSRSIPLLRQRLKVTGDLESTDDHQGRKFDEKLSNAVAVFQLRHGLKVDGVVGKDTREQLNIPADIRVKQIVINMQRWANLAKKLDNRFILVNIPDFHMYLYDNNQKLLSLRAIVGKPDLQTPELTSKINRVVFNPYWNIPDKIAQKDIAPKMLADPNYMSRMHIRAFRQEDDDSSEVNPRDIDWQSAAVYGSKYHLRQDPGADNALGLVKFEFYNSHNVYMHDTSAKNLFENDMRSYSHGCIRLENPFTLVEYLMKDNPEWNNDHIQATLDAGKTKYVKIKNPIPIFITYITSWVDDEGRVNFRDDVYQLDSAVISPGSAGEKLTTEQNYAPEEQRLATEQRYAPEEQKLSAEQSYSPEEQRIITEQSYTPKKHKHHKHRHYRAEEPQFYSY